MWGGGGGGEQTDRQRYTNGGRLRRDGASLGWVRQMTQYCKYASSQSSSKSRNRKGTQTDSQLKQVKE